MAIQKADPRARRVALIVVIATSIFGSLLLYLLLESDERLLPWLEANIDFLLANLWLVGLTGFIAVSPILAAAVYLFVYGRRIIRYERMPPPGYALVKATIIREGSQAVWRGRLLMVLATIVFIAALSVPIVLSLMFYLLSQSAS